MYVTYDSTVDALSISFQERRSGDVARTERLDDRRLVDFDADGSALGVEILGAREFGIDLTGLPRAGEIQTTLHDFPRLPRRPARPLTSSPPLADPGAQPHPVPKTD